jgi:hypothetical protein
VVGCTEDCGVTVDMFEMEGGKMGFLLLACIWYLYIDFWNFLDWIETCKKKQTLFTLRIDHSDLCVTWHVKSPSTLWFCEWFHE